MAKRERKNELFHTIKDTKRQPTLTNMSDIRLKLLIKSKNRRENNFNTFFVMMKKEIIVTFPK